VKKKVTRKTRAKSPGGVGTAMSRERIKSFMSEFPVEAFTVAVGQLALDLGVPDPDHVLTRKLLGSFHDLRQLFTAATIVARVV
jgi:hypothetical protein